MPWSELEDSDGRGKKSTYLGQGFAARLDFDCHGDARKLEVRPTAGSKFVDSLLEHLKPFAEPIVVVPGQLAIVDRAGYFRLYVSPGRLQAQLRKEAPLSVIGELLIQIERAQSAAVCTTCPGLCTTAALTYVPSDPAVGQATHFSLHIDSRRCTHCLDCVRHHADPARVPPALSADAATAGADGRPA